MNLAEDIKQKAFQLGFDLAGITDASALSSEQLELFIDWLALGGAAQMDYMRRNLDKRADPAKLLKNAQSVICVGLNYTPPRPSSLRASQSDARQSHSRQTSSPMGRVANYAQYEDYHPFIKKQLRKLTEFISSIAGTGFSFKICVDSAPSAERALAARAGLGFLGKNHMLINPEFGPQIFLGEIITSLKLQTNEPIKADCSNCNKCLSTCPTGALQPDGRLDAGKCVSYLTTEHKGEIPADLARKIGDHLFGCDECVLACPYLADAPVCKNRQFKFYNDRAKLNLNEILNMNEDNFKAGFAGSVFIRSGLERLKRNARICLNNITY